MPQDRLTESILFKRTPDGVELIETPPLALISWSLLDEAGKTNGPYMTIAHGEISLNGCNATAIYRIVSAKPQAAVVELIRREKAEGK
jgi:hypothetical protein